MAAVPCGRRLEPGGGYGLIPDHTIPLIFGSLLWSMKSGQYQDLDGAVERILDEESEDTPL